MSPIIMLILAGAFFIIFLLNAYVTIKQREEGDDEWKLRFAFSASLLALSAMWSTDYYHTRTSNIAQQSKTIVDANTTYINTGIKTDVNASEVGFRAALALATQNYGETPMKTENGVLYVSKEFAENVGKSTLEKVVREYEKSCAGKAKNLESYEVQK